MGETDYDDPKVEVQWLDCQRKALREYLTKEQVPCGEDFESRWHLVPYVALWAAEPTASERLWAVSGDLPTDYIKLSVDATDRDAMRMFSCRWTEVAQVMLSGRPHPVFVIGKSESNEGRMKLADLLLRRARLLNDWASDNSMW